MTALLVAILAITLGITYATLTTASLATATARLNRAADQLGLSAAGSVAQLKTRVRTAAGHPAVVQAAREALAAPIGSTPPDSARVAAAVARLEALLPAATDTGLTAELWGADGRRIAFAGRDLRPAGQAAPQAAGERPSAPPMPGVPALESIDSAVVGQLYVVEGVRYFWTVAPVFENGLRLGYVARRARIAGSANAEANLRGLTGSDVAGYFRNADGSVWTRISGGAAAPPVVRDSVGDGRIVTRDGAGNFVAVEEPIPGTPLWLALEIPIASTRVTPQATIRRLTLISLAVLLVGVLTSVAISRRITRPLTVLTGAAESIADGDYGARVRPAGADELARLGSSFNRMAAEVSSARDELEMQTEEAQATAEELDQSNRELGAALLDLEQRESQFRTLADTIPQLSWMAHPDGMVFWYNQRWYDYTGTTQEEMSAHGWGIVHHPETLDAVVAHWSASVAEAIPFEMEVPLRGADDAFRWFLVRVLPVVDGAGAVVRWFGTCTDIQSMREAREAAETARADAELARAQAEAANRAKSEFLAVMSHELRTPLNAIGGYTELLELGLRGPVTEAQRRDLDRIRTSQQHLLGLISGVLDLSRIEAGRVSYDLVPTRLDPFLAGLDSLVEPQAAGKSLTLRYVPCDADVAVLVDREKLRQILLNLLSNAIRYTLAGGDIELTAVPHESTVAITVRDTGIGIAAEAVERIFEPFVQLDRSLTRVRDGVGLGLAISLDLARGMGGELGVESREGIGSCFTLTLPRTTVAPDEMILPLTGEYPAVHDGAPPAANA